MTLCCRSLTRTRLAFALAVLTLALGTGVARAETSAGYDKGFFIKSDNWEIPGRGPSSSSRRRIPTRSCSIPPSAMGPTPKD